MEAQSDSLSLSPGLQRLAFIPQPFCKKIVGKTCCSDIKIVYDILAARPNIIVEMFISDFNSKFELGNVAHRPGRLLFYGMNINQGVDYTCWF